MVVDTFSHRVAPKYLPKLFDLRMYANRDRLYH